MAAALAGTHISVSGERRAARPRGRVCVHARALVCACVRAPTSPTSCFVPSWAARAASATRRSASVELFISRLWLLHVQD